MATLQDKYKYEWSDGRSVEHTEWAANNPPTSPSKTPCVAINPETGEWSSEDCGMKFKFFCKFSISNDIFHRIYFVETLYLLLHHNYIFDSVCDFFLKSLNQP